MQPNQQTDLEKKKQGWYQTKHGDSLIISTKVQGPNKGLGVQMILTQLVLVKLDNDNHG